MRPFVKKLLIALGILIVLLAGFVGYVWYGDPSDKPIEATMGKDPLLVEPSPRMIPSVSLVKPVGWGANEAPVPAKGLAVTRFAQGLNHPRTMLTLPNGDVLVALTNSPPSKGGGGVMEWLTGLALKRVGAGDPSPNKIVLLRDADGDGKAEQTVDFRSADMQSPSGMAYRDGTLYISNHDAVLAFAFEPGATTLTGKPRKVMDLPSGGGHWMRNLLLSEDGEHLYVAVGSATNVADKGMEAETGRAAIWEIDTDTGNRRQFAVGMRNPNGMAWNPSSGELWAVVQERDALGPDLVPDYLTNVPVGAQYGWPWVYWKDQFDDRVQWPMQTYMLEYTRKPEYAMGAHAAVLGLLFSNGGNLMGDAFGNGAFVARHGSWNRQPPAGYDVVFVPFDANGNPNGKAVTVLGGFLKPGTGETHGRPTWLAWDKAGGLLVSDDTAGIIWRVQAPGAKPSTAPKPITTERLKPLTEIKEPTRQFQADFKSEPDRELP